MEIDEQLPQRLGIQLKGHPAFPVMMETVSLENRYINRSRHWMQEMVMAFSGSLPFEHLLRIHMEHQEILEIHFREKEVWN